MPDDTAKALQLDPAAHPGAMVCLCLTPEQQTALRDAAGLPDAEADHVTLCYLAPDATAVADRKNAIVAGLTSLAQCTPPLAGEIGGIARFNASESSEGQDVCVALYDCAALPDLRQAIVACCGASPSEHGLVPHITLTYLEPGAALPIAQLERTPLDFAALSLIWAGERIDLPLCGSVVAQENASINYDREAQRVREAWMQQQGEDAPWPQTVLSDGAIVSVDGHLYRIPYQVADDTIVFAERATWVEVEQEYVPSDGAARSLPIFFAPDSLKWAPIDPSNPYVIRVPGIKWGGKDLVDDEFDRQETDIGRSRSFLGMPAYYDHAQRGIKSQVGVVVGVEEDDKELDYLVELDRSKRYADTVLQLYRDRATGGSTGAPGHLVRRKNGKLKRWIVSEISITPTPMEPRTHPAFAGKSLQQEATSMGNEAPTTETPAGADVAQLATQIKSLEAGVAERDKQIADLKSALATKADTATLEPHIASIKSVRSDLDEIRAMPAVKQAKSRDPMEAAAELGGSIGGGLSRYADSYNPFSYHNMKALSSVSHPGSPTRQTMYPEGVFGGFVKALFMSHKSSPNIQRDAIKALEEVYGSSMDSDAAKALGTSAGVSGAWLLSEQFIPQLMAIAGQKDVLYGKTMVIPVDSGEIVIPALDPSTAYSEGQSAYYGGVTVTWGSDDDAALSAEPKFKQVRLSTNALKAFTRVKNSLMMRSAIAIDAVVGNLLGGAIGRARDYAILRGTGQGQPLGVLNSPAAIDQGGSAIDFATLTAMEDNVIPERDENYIWIVHSKKRSAIWSLQQTNNTLVTMLPDLRGKPQMVLLGRPVSYTDKTPFASGDVSNTVNLIDPSMIVCAEFQGIALAVSDQARFEQDETVIRAIMSVDAQPWLTSKVAVTATPDYVSGFITI